LCYILRTVGVPTGTCATGSAGISSCAGRADGDYQSCTTCRGFAACTNERLILMPCPSTLFFDDETKRCEYTSSTCSESQTGSDFGTTGWTENEVHNVWFHCYC